MEQRRGVQSVEFARPVYITGSASVAGEKEREGPLGAGIDRIVADPMCGAESWEQAESAMQEQAVQLALEKTGLSADRIRYLFAGDLLGQLMATTFGVRQFRIPTFGLYGACSTCGEALSLAAMAVNGGYAEYAMALTSSHFASAGERVSISIGIWKPEASLCNLDCDGQRCFYFVRTSFRGVHQRNYYGKDYGLRGKGCAEYGGGYGSGGVSDDCAAFAGFRQKTGGL